MVFGWTLLAALAAFVQVSRAQTCSLYAAPLVEPEVLFDYPTFSDSTPVNKTWTKIVNGALRLTEDEVNGGTVGYAWHFQKERIADGFISTVKFKVSKTNPGLPGDGFTYFIQNDKTVDLNGGSGDKLGAFGIAKSIAIRVDLCGDRPLTCNRMPIGVQLVDKDLQPIGSALEEDFVPPTLANGNEHTLVVVYQGRLFGANAKLKVTLDNQDVFDEAVGNLADPNLFDGRFAFFGFTASTSWTQTANIDITSWKTVIMPSDSALDGFNPEEKFKFEFGTLASFKVIRRNSCKNPVTENDDSVVVESTLNQIPLPDQDPEDAIKLVGNVTNNKDGTYTVDFQLPNQLSANWDLDVLVNGVRAEGMPFAEGVETFKPNPNAGGLPIWALILLLLLILLIILVLSYVVYRLHRYRKKLQENAEFIEAGKKQAELDRLEDGVAYSANRMVGTIDDLKDQLARNEEELERLRKRGALGEDQNFTIEQLQKQRDALLDEMNRLMREEQEDELKKAKQSVNLTANSRTKKEFGREQI